MGGAAGTAGAALVKQTQSLQKVPGLSSPMQKQHGWQAAVCQESSGAFREEVS